MPVFLHWHVCPVPRHRLSPSKQFVNDLLMDCGTVRSPSKQFVNDLLMDCGTVRLLPVRPSFEDAFCEVS